MYRHISAVRVIQFVFTFLANIIGWSNCHEGFEITICMNVQWKISSLLSSIDDMIYIDSVELIFSDIILHYISVT